MTLKEITEMDDLISRWEAFKAVMDDENITNAMDSANDGEMHRTKRAASRIIAGLPSAQQWIPCSERLPSDEGNYIVTVTDTCGAWTAVAEYYPAHPLKWVALGQVIAWIPLPKPYEVKE